MTKKPEFIKIPHIINLTGIKFGNRIIEVPGVWPFINEKEKFLNVIGIGNKNGIDKKIDINLIKKFFPKAKLIFSCQNGPYLVKNYKKILNDFDGHMTLDFDPKNSKSLYMSHTMITRSTPFQGFFWPPEKKKIWDFSILTKTHGDKAKRWDRSIKIIKKLCKSGLKGIVVNQGNDLKNFLRNFSLDNFALYRFQRKGLLKLINHIDHKKFHHLTSMARVGIFPNACDAFPKHILENLLADKPVIISKDLLIGKSVILPQFGHCINFSKKTALDECYKLVKQIKRRNTEYKSRNKWLEKYGFLPLSRQWANELEKKFDIKAKYAFYLNHINKIKENNIKFKT